MGTELKCCDGPDEPLSRRFVSREAKSDWTARPCLGRTLSFSVAGCWDYDVVDFAPALFRRIFLALVPSRLRFSHVRQRDAVVVVALGAMSLRWQYYKVSSPDESSRRCGGLSCQRETLLFVGRECRIYYLGYCLR